VDESDILEAEQVFDEALDFWTQFIYQNQIAKGDQVPAELLAMRSRDPDR
jgi:hypothetical protein